MIPLLNSFLLSKSQQISIRSAELLSLIEKKIISELFECEGDKRMLENILSHAPIRQENIKDALRDIDNEKSDESEDLMPNVYVQVNTNIIEKDNSIRKSLFPFDEEQMTHLFKGYLFNEEKDCKDKLRDGSICDEFFKKTYNKYNNLAQNLAWKRKKVCKKLFNILKVLVILS